MKIERLIIENFKSIERIELIEPNPFTVFVGPNGSGKSNIFEALEFVNLNQKIKESSLVEDMYGGHNFFLNRNSASDHKAFNFEVDFGFFQSKFENIYNDETRNRLVESGEAFKMEISNEGSEPVPLIFAGSSMNFHRYNMSGEDLARDFNADKSMHYVQFFDSFHRFFIGSRKGQKLSRSGNQRLSFSANNLEAVLKRILQNEAVREEIFEWLELFVPSFKAVEVDERNELRWFEKSSVEHFTKDLISDGTYNILALLTAVYQSKEPQFLCIEEPENGLHPEVIMTLVDFFRQQCEEKGHYIWLNTHSESVVKKLTTDEIVLVEKKQGATQIRQIKGRNIYDIPTDDAWLTGALGGGLPW